MECTGPGEGVGHHAGIIAEHLPGDTLDASGHFRRGTPREGHQQDPAGVRAIDNEMRDPMGKSICFARTSSRDHQQRRSNSSIHVNTVFNGSSLLGVK